jgi:hypothetical protein
VSNKHGHRGEHEVSRKTIARGMPGLLRCTCGDYARVLFSFAREATGASSARLSLRPLNFQGERFRPNSDASRRGIADLCVGNTNAPHFHSSSPGLTGRPNIPEASVIEPKGRGVLDTPLEPVIRLAEGETRWRGMTVEGGEVACARNDDKTTQARHRSAARRGGRCR